MEFAEPTPFERALHEVSSRALTVTEVALTLVLVAGAAEGDAVLGTRLQALFAG